MHPQALRSVIRRQSAGSRNRLEQRAEHRGHEIRQSQLGKPFAVDRTRNLDERRHELLLADEHRVVDVEIRLVGGITMLKLPPASRIRVRVIAVSTLLDTHLLASAGRVGVLVAHVVLPSSLSDLALHDIKVDADAPGRLARVQVKQRTVADLRNQRCGCLNRPHLPGGVLGVEAVDCRVDDEIVERTGTVDQCAHRLVAALDSQITRIEIVVGHGDEGLRQERRIQPERVQRCLLSCRVAVEREDDARAERLPFDLKRPDQLDGAQRIVRNQTTDDFRVFRAERGAACGDRRVDTRQMAGHDIRVPLDNHRLAVLHNR